MNNFTIQQLLAALTSAETAAKTHDAGMSTVAAAVTAVLSPAAEEQTPRKPQKRCGFPECKHKLALSDMECKCGVRHCSKHRMPEDHACAFDFKAHDRAVLGKQLVACVGDKIDARI
jgi:predicted nucleic acid binding AN1-type Zn finger protein